MKSNTLNRREFIRSSMMGTGAIAAGLTALTSCTAENGQKRPNIIFLLTDDQRALTLGIDGHPVIKTPNLDKLGSQGVRFTNAFITNPVCMPSRVSMLTGVYERVHGVGFSSGNDLSMEQWESSYPALLRKNGYYTGFIGKFGIERYPFRGNGGGGFDFWRAHDGWAAFFPKNKENCAIYRDSRKDIITPIMAESMDEFLDSIPRDKPFCLSVSFSVPHGSISGSMYPDEGGGDNRMTQPANDNPRLRNHPVYGSLYRDLNVHIPEDTATDPYRFIPRDVMPQEQRRKTYSYSYTIPTCREHHYRYYQLITGMDNAVGSLLRSLEGRNLSDNTVIMFTSDHGLVMGEYGMGGKSLLYDLATRVPFIVYDPRDNTVETGRVNESFVLGIDVAPTILSLAGIEPPEFMQGRDITPLMKHPGMEWRDDIFLENLYVGRETPFAEAVREKDWKYIRYFSNPGRTEPDRDVLVRSGIYYGEDIDFRGKAPIFEQLFNLADDPDEKVNLAGNNQYADVLERFRTTCKRYSDEIMDTRSEYGNRMRKS